MRRTTILLLATTLITPAAALARPMTAEDNARLEQVGDIAVSPDGSRIAYTTYSRPDVTTGEDNGSGSHQLMMAWGPDQVREWLPADMKVSSIGFTPDGRMVTFLWSDKDDKRAVWGVPVDGGAQRKLAGVEGVNVSRYAFTPDGSTAYLIAGPAVDKDRKAEADRGFNSEVYEEELQFNRLFAARIGAEADSDPREIDLPGEAYGMRIAPDGAKAVIAIAPTTLVDDEYTSLRLHKIDLASGKVDLIVETPGKLGDFEISPDGSQLSLVAAVDKNDPADTTLHLVDLASGAFRAINGGAAEAAEDTEWLADGRLAVTVDIGADSVLRLYNPDGSVSEQIDPGELILQGVESAGGKLAVTADAPRFPGELFTLDNGGFTRWTNHNDWLSEIDFAPQRMFSYTARDGQTVDGVLIEPLGGPEMGGSPTIMMVHGGPESHYSNGWLTNYSMPGQVGAGKGYAVFHPNYRGSTGYGVAYAKAHQNDYAGKEFNDIVDAKMALVDAGVTDPDRTGITGGSYGGYASAWGATALTEHYAAAVMFVGISNQISKFGTTDIPQEMFLVHSRKWPWEDWQNMLEVSPVYHAGQANTPLLIMHGADDTRVHPSQSMELYRNIKVRTDTPVRLVFFPGEGHGNGKAASRYDYNLRMLEWFDTYLKTGDREAAMPPARPRLPAIDDGETGD